MLCRAVSPPHFHQVCMADFEAALDEVQPAFGANTESLQKHVMQVGGWAGWSVACVLKQFELQMLVSFGL